MSRKRNKRKRSSDNRSRRPVVNREQQYVHGAVGMISVKTIRTRDGKIVLKQGERIREEVLAEYQQHEVLEEILANAMPGRER